MPKETFKIKEHVKNQIKEPGEYSVVFHNDDFTPMDFVTSILMVIFHKSEEEATQLMLKVHHEGKATVGIFTFDIACTKADTAMIMARDNGYPLRITVNKI